MRFETTVQRAAAATGVGLHSGVAVSIRILPAPVSTGIVFLRTDLDNFAIPASWRNVARVSYATSLMRQGVLISTTEHLLSVFYSMGIDNAFVEIDNLEVPILDGSGMPFVELIASAGIRHYRRKRRYLRIRRPVSVEEGYRASRFRESRDARGTLTYVSGADRLALIEDMVVWDLERERNVKLRDLPGLGRGERRAA